MTSTGTIPPAPPGTPVVGHALAFARDPFGFVRGAVESTGDVFRMSLLGRDVYVVADPDLVGAALLDRESFAKLGDFEVAFGEALLAVEGEQWRRQRRDMEEFFAPRRIRAEAGTMASVADDRIDGWPTTGEVRLDGEMRSIALANLFEVVLGQSLSPERVDELAEVARALNRWFEPSSWALPDWLPTPARREFRRGSERLRELAGTLLDGAADASARGSLLARLAELREDPSAEWSNSEITDQVIGMLFAGHETTALSLTYALCAIGSRPAVAERFRAEVDDVIEGRPTPADLDELTYTGRIVEETLRLYPPVHTVPRVTTEAVDLGPYALPADAEVLLSVWNVHRDPRFYDDPLEFDPGRWADATPRGRGDEFLPFGGGPRTCIGRHFARLETKAVLAAIGRRYEFDVGGDPEVTPQMTTQPAEPVAARVRERR
ncbi:MAG: cytochrome P450 [Salinigranum sp.]